MPFYSRAIRFRAIGAFLAGMVAISVFAGCSGASNPVNPSVQNSGARVENSGNRMLWGMWHVAIDAEALRAEVTPYRSAEFTANVTRFMQPPVSPTNMVQISIGPGGDPSSGFFVVDVTLRHPFPGMNMYNGFDVRGILLSDGSVTGAHDSTVLRAGADNTRLLNPDGYTRWWNYPEFTSYETIFGYTHGKLAPPGQPSATVNPYKYFADELGAEDPVWALDPGSRGVFSTQPGTNQRRYEIQFPMNGPQVVLDFDYAVDASWSQPDKSFAPEYPEEAFDLSANCMEAYMAHVEDAGSTAWFVDSGNKGGDIKLSIEVFDHQAPANPDGIAGEIAAIWLEGEVLDSPVNVLPVATVLPGSGGQSSIYEVDLSSLNLTHSGAAELLGTIESANVTTYEPQVPGGSAFGHPDAILSAYFTWDASISDQPIAQAPTVSGIDPNWGVSGFLYENVTVTGANFLDGATASLVQGATEIVAESTTFIDQGTLDTSFELDGAPGGLYDVVVTNPDLQDGSLDDGFEVKILNLTWEQDKVVHPINGSVYWATSIDDREPRLLVTSSGQPFIGWGQWPTAFSAIKGGSTTTDDGQTWTGEIWQPFAANYHADVKLALDDTDSSPGDYNVYIVVTHRNTSWQTVGSHTGMARWRLQGTYSWPGEQGINPASGGGVGNGQEFIWTAGGYPVYVRDKDQTMYCKVGTFQHSIRGNPAYSSGSWYNMTEQNLGEGFVSDNRSIARAASGAIFLAIGKPDKTKVQIITNTNGTGTGWSSPVNIHDEGPDGGIVEDPGLDIAQDGTLRVAFRRQNVVGNWEVCFAMSDTGGAGTWSDLEVVYMDYGGTGGLDRSAIDSETVFDIDISGITFCVNDKIYYAWKPMGASSWKVVQVNTNNLECLEPDTVFSPTTATHVVWSQSDNVKHDIWHRRGIWSN